MIKMLRVLPVILLLAVALIANVSASSAAKLEIENPMFSPNPAQVGDNFTEETDNVTVIEGAPLAGTSFWSIFDPWVWWSIGGVIGVLIIMIIVLVAVPSRKKQGAAAIKGGKGMQGMAGMQGGMPVPTPMSGSGSFNPPVGTTRSEE